MHVSMHACALLQHDGWMDGWMTTLSIIIIGGQSRAQNKKSSMVGHVSKQCTL